MTWLTKFPGREQALSMCLYTLYMITAVRICRYASWQKSGAPNPFLPRRIKAMLRKRQIAQMARGQFPTFA